jgi:protein TonB
MKKIVIITFLAGLTTFSLFAFMAFLISNDQVIYIAVEDDTVVEVASLPEDTPVIEPPKVKLTPPPPPQPMPKTTVSTDNSDTTVVPTYTPIGIPINTSPVSITGLGNKADRDARPVVRVNPKYPISAARDGIEGWVVLAFDINEIGQVINIEIIDSQPKRTFDKAAKQALKKWKYRAKSIDGKQVQQKNFTVQLDFSMSQDS